MTAFDQSIRRSVAHRSRSAGHHRRTWDWEARLVAADTNAPVRRPPTWKRRVQPRRYSLRLDIPENPGSAPSIRLL